MALSIFLAKLFGVYMIIKGLAIITRRKMWLAWVDEFMSEKTLFYIVVFFELLAGLSLVLAHNIWVAGWPVVITIFGWLMLIEALVYIFSSHKVAKDIIDAFNKPGFYNLFSILAIVLGIWLAYQGFTLG